jgi:sortase A
VAPVTVPIAAGDPIARLEIPAIGLDVVVVSGVSVDDLRRGPGHYPDTPLPGEYGNSAIAGHRTTYGQPFHDVDDLEPGDEIVVTTIAGRFVYAVTGTEIVDPGDIHVVATTDPNTAQLTLTSCHPKWSARQRIIVRSELVADQSAPVGPPPSATSAPVETTSPIVSSPSTSSLSTSSTSTSPTAPTATTATTASSGGPSDTPTVTTPSADAFADGWFHDRSAIPQVALWALVVMAIAAGAHLLGRRVRRGLVGIGVGTLPFLIALYFFYQNVNRLLPPSL